MKQLLDNWIAALDRQIGDREEQIRARREANANAVRVRDDVTALEEYLESNNPPPEVKRALELCLSWNPFCREAK